MSDQYENVRHRLEQSLRGCSYVLTNLLHEARKDNAILSEVDPEILAENLISSFQGALLRSKVKKSSGPLNNFIHLYFDKFLPLK